MAKKFYGVKEGKVPGVYSEWSKVQEQINGYSGASYKGFSTEEEARIFVFGECTTTKVDTSSIKKEPFREDVLIYTDGSFINEKVGFGIVVVKDNSPIIKDCGRFIGREEDIAQRNVAGEIYAMIRAIQLVKANEFNNICFCYDYEGIRKWITGEWKAKNQLTQRYVEYFNKYMNGIEYEFKHIPAHSGEQFNEEADRLAKLGSTL